MRDQSDRVSRIPSHKSRLTNHRFSTRHCVPSRFRANSFKTKDRRTRYPTLIEGAAQHRFRFRKTRPSTLALVPAHRFQNLATAAKSGSSVEAFITEE